MCVPICCSGRENLCRGTIHLGHGQGWGELDFCPGAYAEYCLAWSDLLYPIPDDTPLDRAAMADVLCVAVDLVGRAGSSNGNVPCIAGGPVGFSIAQVAKARGAREIFTSEPSAVARRLAEIGGLPVIDPRCETIASAVAAGNGSAPAVAAVYGSIGSAETMAEALPLLEESGTYVNAAVHDGAVGLNATALGSERTITSFSKALYRDVRQAYELTCSGKVNVGPMISHRFGLEDYAEAFELLLSSPKRAYKIVLNPNG